MKKIVVIRKKILIQLLCQITHSLTSIPKPLKYQRVLMAQKHENEEPFQWNS